VELFGEKTCGMRDCQLEVFSIEDDEIITGGFCPRGNSEASGRPKTNYVDKYHKIYEKHFKEQGVLQKDLASADLTGKGATVGIKRSTATLGEKGIWSAALFNKLGFCPVVSPRSDSEIAKIGVDNSRTEFCIARKLATGHASVLNDDPKIEFLFNPSFIEQRTGEKPDLKYCIYTESEGYVLNDVLSLDKAKQLNPILHFGDDELVVQAFRREFERLGFAFTDKQIEAAMRYADESEALFKAELYSEGDKFLEKIEAGDEKAYVGIGRDYVLLDPEASSHSGSMFSQVRGLDYIPQLFLEHKFEDIELKPIVENEFWVQSVKILRANVYVADHPKLFSIRMMNFACGPDSLKIYQEEKIQQAASKPTLVLLTDAQTNNAPFVTRTEAHERVVNQTKHKKLKFEKIKRRPRGDTGGRTWLLPYMGDASYVGAAGLRGLGVDAMVLPTFTQRGYEVARKHIYTEVCQPLKGVVGDAIGFLHEQIEQKGRDFVEQNYLVMLPTTSGPCRFGKYSELMREFLDIEGLEKIPVAGPSSETDYFDIPLPQKLTSSEKMKMQKMLFKGIKGSDMLEDIYLRFRPYAKDKQQILDLRTTRLRALEKVVEAGAEIKDLVAWGEETVRQFKALGLEKYERFPIVLYIGEIYVRQHDPCTGFVIQQLEEQGLEVVRDPVSDWLDYVNKMNLRNAKRDLKLRFKQRDFRRMYQTLGQVLKSSIKSRYMTYSEEKIAEPFHEVLHGRHVLPKPMQMIETLEANHECHGNIEGESPLSTGIAYHLMNDMVKPHGDACISGIFHVGPFTCMQEGVATAKIEAMAKELRKKKPDLVFPIVHAFFGDSASANLDSEIAVFKEQCYQRKQMLQEIHS
jgi:predicted nucleotide-binding protein (sugar kinase/HSP70/actin superfamily)